MSIKVLIVEDDPVFRDAFVQAIAEAIDLTLVGEAATLAQGLALLAMQPEVLLVDLQLPDGNGIDLIQAATQRLPDCETMVVTVFGDESSVLDSIAA
ncbi:MAG: response regulator transcription factor, partial [Steroidobacteraceae bacterium]